MTPYLSLRFKKKDLKGVRLVSGQSKSYIFCFDVKYFKTLILITCWPRLVAIN